MSNEPQLEFLFEGALETALPHAIGENPHGNRAIIPVTGDRLKAPTSKGRFFLVVQSACSSDQMGWVNSMCGKPGRRRMVPSCM
jgi:uncharacterized protein DUF3237